MDIIPLFKQKFFVSLFLTEIFEVFAKNEETKKYLFKKRNNIH